jgi:hypothetical protein
LIKNREEVIPRYEEIEKEYLMESIDRNKRQHPDQERDEAPWF